MWLTILYRVGYMKEKRQKYLKFIISKDYERNNRVFQNAKQSYNSLWEEMIMNVALWSTKLKLFCNYDGSVITLNQQVFLQHSIFDVFSRY